MADGNDKGQVKGIYFFDTYALIELIEGNPNYQRFDTSEMVLSMLNLMEFDYYCIRKNRKDRKSLYNYLKGFCLSINDEIIHKAAELKYQHKGKAISFTDAVGYHLAMENKIKFLTGDKDFKDMENVEFVL